MNPLRILLADDHRLFRQGLRELIERKTQHRVVGEASSGEEALELVAALRPDLLFLDLHMPGIGGLEAARRLERDYPSVKIIVLTMYREDQHVIEAVQAGARAYLLKDADAGELISVIERVAAGDAALDRAVTKQVLNALQRLKSAPAPELSERELAILALVAEGQDNRTIAAQLGIAEKTVGNRMSEIFAKLGASNRTQAALIAIQRGLVPAPREL